MEKETARMEAFSDGVFAIAITLLVLDVHVPEQVTSKAALLTELRRSWPYYLAFLLSFSSIYIMWVNHHKLFKQIYKRNSAITFLNGFLLLLATSVSYPTALLARYYDSPAQSLVVQLYTGLFVLITLTYTLLWTLASKHQDLLRPDLTPETITQIKHTYRWGVAGHSMAFVTAFVAPPLALLLSAALWTYWAFTSGRLELAHLKV